MTETPESAPGIRLTQTVQKGGCAAKVAAKELRSVLAQVRFPPSPPELKIGAGTFDDAAIYEVSPALSLVQTLDFFTPIVDTPCTFGQIAAANALSDVYAMGGTPKTAMAILAYPLGTLENSVIAEVLQGASDKIAEAGAALVGGHTIDDDTLKFGLSVTGFVHPKAVWSNAGAQPGDALVLTKPLGTGTLTAALKRGEVSENAIEEALASMCRLNDVAGLLSQELRGQIRAATDITGFGLAGHALNLARASNVSLSIRLQDLPSFSQAMDLLGRGFLTKAHRTNAEYVRDDAVFEKDDPIRQQLVYDPQTSGGLLLAVPASIADRLVDALREKFPGTSKVGTVQSRGAKHLHFC